VGNTGTVIMFLDASMARTIVGLNPGRGEKYFLPHKFLIGPRTHPTLNSFPAKECLRGVNCPSVNLTIYTHLMKKRNITGAMPPLPHMSSQHAYPNFRDIHKKTKSF
jgi:hypothetical protein